MKKLALLFVFTLLLGMTSAWAAPLDTVDWGQLGPSFTLLITPENWVSAGGLTGEIGITGSFIGTQNMQRLDQGNGWGGNFLPGDHLVWNEGGFQQTGIDIGILFNQGVGSAGAQIQADYYGAFTATVTAFDGLGNVIGTNSLAGNSNGNADGSAIFIGFTSNSNNIAFLDFNVIDQFGGDSLAIDTLQIGSAAVPEPGTLLLLGSGLLGAIGYTRRRLSL